MHPLKEDIEEEKDEVKEGDERLGGGGGGVKISNI